MTQITRNHKSDETISLTNSEATTGRIDIREFPSAGIIITALVTGVSITWRVAKTLTGTTYPLKRSGAAITDTIAENDALQIPDEAFNFPYAVPVLNAGTGTADVCAKG